MGKLYSTLESYFSGEKELFKGLYIEEKENARGKDAWTEYPVISFCLSGRDYNSPTGLADTLSYALGSCAGRYQLDWDFIAGDTLPVRFRKIIEALYEKTGRQVVVLVDECDKPVLSTMFSNPEQEKKNRELYKGFFSVLKDMDGYLKFVFFTGVTRSMKLSIFTDLNQLVDISLDDAYSGICGITESEMLANFEPEIGRLADKQKMSRAGCLAQLKKMYGGYHFSRNGASVYNPFSLLSAFVNKDFRRCWFGTGTSDILIKKLQDSSMSLPQITEAFL